MTLAHISSDIAAQRIFEAAEGDARRAYEYLDEINRHLTNMLYGRKEAMNEDLKLPPGREPLSSDWFAEQLGRSQQKVMSLTVAKRRLEARLDQAEERAEVLEELIMDVVADLRDSVLRAVILERIAKVMRRLDVND